MSYFLVCKASDLNPGEMRNFSAGNTEILLCNLKGTFTAIHPKCSHYGAPLEEGVINGYRIVCPWHHACFDGRTGRHLEAPGCDALQSYRVDVREGDVWVRIDEEEEDGFKPNPMSTGHVKEGLPYVVVGGSLINAIGVSATVNGGVGATLWFAENFGLKAQLLYKYVGNSNPDQRAHKMPSFGLVYSFKKRALHPVRWELDN